MTYYGLRSSQYRSFRACTLCLGTETPAPVTGAAADEYNLNVVDCNASVTVARPAVLNLSQWGSGYPQPPEANVIDRSIVLLLFLQKQNLATAIYLFGLGTRKMCMASPGPAGNFKFPTTVEATSSTPF